MTKLFMVLFAGLTALAVYATVIDLGVYTPSVITRSVRDGSAGNQRPQGK